MLSQIQYEAYISYKQLKDYLMLLVQHKLIEYVKKGKMFRITENGTDALNLFDEMDKLAA
jgi:predicted transcriptional regulator